MNNYTRTFTNWPAEELQTAIAAIKTIVPAERTSDDWVKLSYLLYNYANYTTKLDPGSAFGLFSEAITSLPPKKRPTEWCHLALCQDGASTAAANSNKKSEAIIYCNDAIATMKYILQKKQSPSLWNQLASFQATLNRYYESYPQEALQYVLNVINTLKQNPQKDYTRTMWNQLADCQSGAAKIYAHLGEIALEIEYTTAFIETYKIIKTKVSTLDDAEVFINAQAKLKLLNNIHNITKNYSELSPSDNDLITLTVEYCRLGGYLEIHNQFSDSMLAFNKLFDYLDKIKTLYVKNEPVVDLSLYAMYALKILGKLSLPQLEFETHATRYLSYVDSKTEQKIIQGSEQLKAIVDKEKEDHAKHLQEIGDQKLLPEESKSLKIMPLQLVTASRSIFQVRHKPALTYPLAHMWMMNPGLQTLMIQGWNRDKGADAKAHAVLPFRLWPTILTFIGNLSYQEARFFHDTMRFFARKAVLLADVERHVPTSTWGKLSNTISGAFSPSSKNRAINLKDNITAANSSEELITVLKKEAAFFTNKPLNTNEKKPQEKYQDTVEKHFKRLSLPWG